MPSQVFHYSRWRLTSVCKHARLERRRGRRHGFAGRGGRRRNCYDERGMKKIDITRRIARRSKLSRAAAADQLDRVVHRILKNLRKGKAVSLPGLGTFKPGAKPAFEFLAELSREGARGGKKR